MARLRENLPRFHASRSKSPLRNLKDGDLRHKLVAKKVERILKLSKKGHMYPKGGRVKYHKPPDPDRIMKDFQRLKNKFTQIKGCRPNLDTIIIKIGSSFADEIQVERMPDKFQTLLEPIHKSDRTHGALIALKDWAVLHGYSHATI